MERPLILFVPFHISFFTLALQFNFPTRVSPLTLYNIKFYFRSVEGNHSAHAPCVLTNYHSNVVNLIETCIFNLQK